MIRCLALILPVALLLVLASLPGRLAAATTAAAPVVIFKLDDLHGTRGADTAVPHQWQQVVDLVVAKDIAAAFGISGKDLEGADEGFIAWCRERQADPRFELWNHGFTHGRRRTPAGESVAEFQDALEQQREAFTRTQRLAKDSLGFPFRAFGSPFNVLTADTATVLAEDPDLRVWFYGREQLAQQAGFDGLVLGRALNIEHPVCKANAERFIADYEQRRGSLPPYLCLQGHPGAWNGTHLADFERIVDFLLAEGCRFTTPSAYAAQLAADGDAP